MSCALTSRHRLFPRTALAESFEQHVDAVATPEQLAVEHEHRHAEHAHRLMGVGQATRIHVAVAHPTSLTGVAGFQCAEIILYPQCVRILVQLQLVLFYKKPCFLEL